jgi:hypothetical protein
LEGFLNSIIRLSKLILAHAEYIRKPNALSFADATQKSNNQTAAITAYTVGTITNLMGAAAPAKFTIDWTYEIQGVSGVSNARARIKVVHAGGTKYTTDDVFGSTSFHRVFRSQTLIIEGDATVTVELWREGGTTSNTVFIRNAEVNLWLD